MRVFVVTTVCKFGVCRSSEGRPTWCPTSEYAWRVFVLTTLCAVCQSLLRKPSDVRERVCVVVMVSVVAPKDVRRPTSECAGARLCLHHCKCGVGHRSEGRSTWCSTSECAGARVCPHHSKCGVLVVAPMPPDVGMCGGASLSSPRCRSSLRRPFDVVSDIGIGGGNVFVVTTVVAPLSSLRRPFDVVSDVGMCWGAFLSSPLSASLLRKTSDVRMCWNASVSSPWCRSSLRRPSGVVSDVGMGGGASLSSPLLCRSSLRGRSDVVSDVGMYGGAFVVSTVSSVSIVAPKAVRRVVRRRNGRGRVIVVTTVSSVSVVAPKAVHCRCGVGRRSDVVSDVRMCGGTCL